MKNCLDFPGVGAVRLRAAPIGGTVVRLDEWGQTFVLADLGRTTDSEKRAPRETARIAAMLLSSEPQRTSPEALLSATSPEERSSPRPSGGSRARVERLVRRFGANTTSHQCMGSAYRAWFFPSLRIEGDEAMVGYVDTGDAWVAAGDPMGPGYLLGEATQAFVRAAHAHGRRVAFVAAERSLEGLRAVPVGLSPEWVPAEWETTLRGSPKLREQLRRARAKGVRARCLRPDELVESAPMRAALEDLARSWLDARRAPPLHFLTRLDLSELGPDHRVFVAERDGKLSAAAILRPIPLRRGLLLEHLLRARDAPNGTSESVVDRILTSMLERREEVLSLGTAPLAGECPPLFRAVRRLTRGLYDFDGLFAFKARLHPTTFRTTYLAFPPEQGLLASSWDALSAFAGGSPLVFLLSALARKIRARVSRSPAPRPR